MCEHLTGREGTDKDRQRPSPSQFSWKFFKSTAADVWNTLTEVFWRLLASVWTCRGGAMRQREAPIQICKGTSPEPEEACLKQCHFYVYVVIQEREIFRTSYRENQMILTPRPCMTCNLQSSSFSFRSYMLRWSHKTLLSLQTWSDLYITEQLLTEVI